MHLFELKKSYFTSTYNNNPTDNVLNRLTYPSNIHRQNNATFEFNLEITFIHFVFTIKI